DGHSGGENRWRFDTDRLVRGRTLLDLSYGEQAGVQRGLGSAHDRRAEAVRLSPVERFVPKRTPAISERAFPRLLHCRRYRLRRHRGRLSSELSQAGGKVAGFNRGWN